MMQDVGPCSWGRKLVFRSMSIFYLAFLVWMGASTYRAFLFLCSTVVGDVAKSLAFVASRGRRYVDADTVPLPPKSYKFWQGAFDMEDHLSCRYPAVAFSFIILSALMPISMDISSSVTSSSIPKMMPRFDWMALFALEKGSVTSRAWPTIYLSSLAFVTPRGCCSGPVVLIGLIGIG